MSLLSQLHALGITKISKKKIRVLSTHGYDSLESMCAASVSDLAPLIGHKLASKWRSIVENAFDATVHGDYVDHVPLMLASNLLPGGVDESKVKVLLETYPDIVLWSSKKRKKMSGNPPPHFSIQEFKNILDIIPKYRRFLDNFWIPHLPYSS